MPGILGTMALVKGGSALGKYAYNRFLRPKRKKFDQTAYGQQLSKVMNEGVISNAQKGNIVGRTSEQAGNVASNRMASYTGRMVNMGQQGSIAAQRGLNEIGAQYNDIIGQTVKDVEMQNELSKSQAAMEYAKSKTGYNEQTLAENRQASDQLVGGLIDAGAGYLGGKAMNKLYEGLDINEPDTVDKFLTNHPNKAEAINEIYKLALTNQYAGGDGGIIPQTTITKMSENLQLLGLSAEEIDKILEPFGIFVK